MLQVATRKSEECSPGPSNGYGVGVELYLDGTRVLAYGHHGDMTGYGAVVLGDPEHEVTICVCSNFRGSEDLGMESSLDLLLAASGSLRALRYVFRSAPVKGLSLSFIDLAPLLRVERAGIVATEKDRKIDVRS